MKTSKKQNQFLGILAMLALTFFISSYALKNNSPTINTGVSLEINPAFSAMGNYGKCGDGKMESHKKAEKKEGEAKCGKDQKKEAKNTNKCGNGKCGDDKQMKKNKASNKKCGDGKCGNDKTKKSKKEKKCGDGKCGK